MKRGCPARSLEAIAGHYFQRMLSQRGAIGRKQDVAVALRQIESINEQFLEIIFDLKRSGIGILITDHAVRETLVVTDRAYIINKGRIFRGGSPEALERDPEVKRIYLGETFSLRV